MQNEKIAQDILNFNKNAVKMSFDALSSFSDQTAKAAELLLGSLPNVPEESKKAVGSFYKESQKSLTSLKTCVEAGLAIDWTAKDAGVKSLELMEKQYNNACTQAGAQQKEAKDLFKKSSEQLPKEAKPVVDFWTDALNSNFQMFQGIVTKNFEFAKKVLVDVAAEETTKTASK